MRDRLRPLVRSFIPFTTGRDDGTGALKALRMALILLSVFNPLFWWVYRSVDPEAFDPAWGRLGLLGVSLGLLGLSYANTLVRRRPYEILAVVLYGTLVWFGVLTYVNDLSPNYALGYLFVIVAVAMVYSTICASSQPMAGMLGFAGALGLAIVAGVEAPGMSPAVFLVTLGPGAFIVYVAFSARLSAVRALNRSERQLAEAEMLALTGSWTTDLRTLERTWSAGAERLLGVEPRGADGDGLTAFVHPDDREAARDALHRLGAERDWTDLRTRIVRPGGEVRHVRAVVRLVRADDGSPRRHEGALLDVTDQVAYEAELEAARDTAEAAAAAKTSFLANMSHEIRTPLTAIIGFAQLLGEDIDEENASLVEPIESGGRRLLDTLNSVLDLARIESDNIGLDLVPVDVAAEVSGVANLLRVQAEVKGLALSLDVPARPVAVLGDRSALARVITNLLANAIKFTDAGGVSVSLHETEAAVEIEVADTGRGMDEVFLDRLFEPFHQASEGWDRTHEGSGLGLTITRSLVEAMLGTVLVESQLGIGTRFVVSLPRASEATVAAVSASEPVAA
ncbi:MAG: PAS domain-containing sensor histidine kinase [Bacteroidota bacterium]